MTHPRATAMKAEKSYIASYSWQHIAKHNLPLAGFETDKVQPCNVEIYSVIEVYPNNDVLYVLVDTTP